MINVCEINWQRNYEDRPRPTSAPVCARRNRRESKEKNEMSLFFGSILLITDGSE
jgi:hypothetical protein